MPQRSRARLVVLKAEKEGAQGHKNKGLREPLVQERGQRDQVRQEGDGVHACLGEPH